MREQQQLLDLEHAQSTIAQIGAAASKAVTEYRADRKHGDGGWGESLCEVLELITTAARR